MSKVREGISTHFKREAKLMLWLFVGLPVALTVLALLLGALLSWLE